MENIQGACSLSAALGLQQPESTIVRSIACSNAETYFLEELNRLDESVANLNAKRKTLLRALAQERQRRIGRAATMRPYARQCAMIEIEVLAALRLAETATLPTQELFTRVRSRRAELIASTFRSILRRMRAKNLIAPVPGKRGAWTLSPAPGK